MEMKREANGHWIYTRPEAIFSSFRIWFEKEFRHREWCWYHRKWEQQDLWTQKEKDAHQKLLEDYIESSYDPTGVFG